MTSTIGIVSLSSGIIGEDFVKHEVDLGAQRLKDLGLNPIFLPHSLKGLNFVKEHPEARAEDLMQAFSDDSIDMILAVEELCVCDIACLLNLSMASASHHLRKLANQNILDTRREGKIIYYFIKDEEIRDFFNQLG